MLLNALIFLFFFFFNDTATTEIYTLSLHDALPISSREIGPTLRSEASWALTAKGCWNVALCSNPQDHCEMSFPRFCLRSFTAAASAARRRASRSFAAFRANQGRPG